MNIKSYDGEVYSGTDEEYAEFLKNIDGTINDGEPVEDDLGATKKINLQGVIDKFRKTAGGIKDVSKKITSEAVNKFEDFKKSRDNRAEENEAEDYYESDAEYAEETVPPEITEESYMVSDEFTTDLKSVSDKTETLISEAEHLKDKVDTLEINVRDTAMTVEEIKHKTDSVSEAVEEIRKAVSGINKLNDSIFDLKNAQLNSKNSLEELEKSFLSLKKKCIWGVAIVSVLTFISIAIEIIILLS